MTSASTQPSKIVAVFDGWHFTREAIVDPAYVEAFHELYALAFTPLLTRSPARQVLTDAEFHDQMSDERIDKYLAWGDEGEPVGLTTLTTHLEAIPWISPQFFAARYPEQWRRNAVYYLGFTLVHRQRRQTRIFRAMVERIVELLVAERAVCAWDICAFNDEVLGLNDNIERILHGCSDVPVVPIDRQTYYAGTFHGSRDGRG